MKEYKQMAFNTFARLHPLDAYDSDPVRFCNFVRETTPTMTDEEIKEIIEQVRRSK